MVNGLVLLDRAPRRVALSQDYEGLDGAVVYSGQGRYYLALYQGGESAAGQPANRRQAVRVLQLDFASGKMETLARYEDARWTARSVLDFYGLDLNREEFSLALSCRGMLYLGGALKGDSPDGRLTMRIWSLPVSTRPCRARS